MPLLPGLKNQQTNTMPLYKTINFSRSVGTTTQILIWKITESFTELFAQVELNETNRIRLDGMKSTMHQRAFLSVRKLFQEVGYTDFDLYYDKFGKPHLHDGKHISITHSHQFSAIIISDETVGIDIELQREKITRIADKFVNEAELARLKNTGSQDYIKKLTVKWGAKEAIFKTGYFSKFDCLLIQITKDENNVPIVIDSLSSRPISNMHLSISHSKKTAVAIAIWETKK